jgi:hypothetical protein
MNVDETKEDFLLGVVYVIKPNRSFEETERDIINIKEVGFKAVTLWPVVNTWLTDKPDEFVYDDTVKVLDLLHKYDLKAKMQLIGQNPHVEYAPDCLLTKDMTIDYSCFSQNLNHRDVEALVE